jgi:peroxiredoxin
MLVLLLVARLVLAAVFVTAAFAKLADRAGSKEALRNFGIPGRILTPVAVLLPVVELAVAVALIPTWSARWGALGALALLVVFTIAIAANLVRGSRPDCRCFGQLHSAPLGWTTLARNAILGVTAGFVVWQGWDRPGASATHWLGQLTAAEAVALSIAMLSGVVVAVESWLLLNLLRQHGRLLLRLDALEDRSRQTTGSPPATIPSQPTVGLSVGSLAPEFRLTGVEGGTITLRDLRGSSKPVMLLFTDPGCGPCVALMPEIAGWQNDHADKLTIALVSSGTLEANQAKASEHRLEHVLVQEGREVAEAYRGAGTPSAVVVDPDGRIAVPLAAGAESIRSMLRRAIHSPAALPLRNAHAHHDGNGAYDLVPPPSPPAPPATGLPVGATAPEFALPGQFGEIMTLAALRSAGRPVLLLFVDAGCGPCKTLLPKVGSWQTEHVARLTIAVVGSGNMDELRVKANEHGVMNVLAQQRNEVSEAYRCPGTPSAVAVSPAGKIADHIAAGVDPISKLVLRLTSDSPPRRIRGELNQPSVNSNASRSANAVSSGSGLPIGTHAPQLVLPDIDGRNIDLAHFKGQETLLIFWNPACGYCKRIVNDLRAYEDQDREQVPNLLMISSGTVSTNRELHFRSTVLIDGHAPSAMRLFGANGTPTAVLIDANGRIASPLAIGGPSVLALTRSEEANQKAASETSSEAGRTASVNLGVTNEKP